jgi:hypothetical protein
MPEEAPVTSAVALSMGITPLLPRIGIQGQNMALDLRRFSYRLQQAFP